jgi:hypothetical protein
MNRGYRGIKNVAKTSKQKIMKGKSGIKDKFSVKLEQKDDYKGRGYYKNLAKNSNVMLITGEQGIKKLGQNCKLKVITRERGIKKSSLKL